jgi:succinoglycan biosynthesis protein ExoA
LLPAVLTRWVLTTNVSGAGTGGEPAVSVVIPCRNERDQIKATLETILAQESPPGGFEIIVVDGMSDDGTRQVLAEVSRGDRRLKLIDNPERTTACGMNAGIRHARGRYIAIMGAHNRYATDYLCSSLIVLQETGADNVGGAMFCVGESRLQKAIAIAHHRRFAVGGARWHNMNYEGPADTVFGGVYRRDVFDRIGLFDEELVRNQDDEFNLRLSRAGGKIWQSRRIKSWYTPRSSLRDLFLQYVQYGYWKVRVIQKHKLPASVRHVVPGCFVLSLAILLLAGIFFPFAGWALFAVLSTYLVCNLIASLITAGQNGLALLTLLPIVFAAYHFGYGCGFIRGIWDFVILGRGPSPTYTKLSRPPVG